MLHARRRCWAMLKVEVRTLDLRSESKRCGSAQDVEFCRVIPGKTRDNLKPSSLYGMLISCGRDNLIDLRW